MRDLVNKVLSEYDEGLYTLETKWRLVTLVEEPNQVRTLLACLPSDLAEGWLVYLREQFGGGARVNPLCWMVGH